MKDCMDGFAFVKEVIEYSRDSAVDILMSKGIDECDWLELKASFYVADTDADFSNDRLLSARPEGFGDRQWLDELNKGRIVKDIIALYNSRGGVIFIGISPDRLHQLIPLHQNDPDGTLNRLGVNDYLSKINGLLTNGEYWFGTGRPARHYLSIPVGNLYESKILPYKNGCVIALVVKSRGRNNSCVIICDDAYSSRNAKSFLLLRQENGNNREECVSGITESKKDELDRQRYELLQKNDLSRLFEELTGGEYSPTNPGTVTWKEVWRKLWTFSLHGKATRAELWMSYGYYSVFVMGAICLSIIFGNARILSIVQFLGFVLLTPPFVRRLHDWGLSGWCLLVLIGFGMFEGFFPNLITAKSIVNGFFFLGLLSLGCFPGRRLYGKYKGTVFSVCFFALLLMGGFVNRSALGNMNDEQFAGCLSDLEGEPEPTANDALVYGIDAVGNEFGETFDKLVIPALKNREKNSLAIFGASIERMAADMHRVADLVNNLCEASDGEFGMVDGEFYGMLEKLIAALDVSVEVSIREDTTISKIRESFAHVEVASDLLFRRADVLCKDRLKGPFQGLVHRIGDALKIH